MKETLVVGHPRWKEFIEKLEGVEGCDFRELDGKITHKCSGNYSKAISILTAMKEIDVEGSLSYFREHGGFCDCEILYNVEPDQ